MDPAGRSAHGAERPLGSDVASPRFETVSFLTREERKIARRFTIRQPIGALPFDILRFCTRCRYFARHFVERGMAKSQTGLRPTGTHPAPGILPTQSCSSAAPNPTSSPASKSWSMAASRSRRGRQPVGMPDVASWTVNKATKPGSRTAVRTDVPRHERVLDADFGEDNLRTANTADGRRPTLPRIAGGMGATSRSNA